MSATSASLQQLADAFTAMGKELLDERALDDTMRLVTARAMVLIESAEHASISRGRSGRFETVGETSELPLKVDAWQYELGSGPCVDAAIDNGVYRTGKLGQDQRWPEFGRVAYERYGIASMLSVRLYLEDDDQIAALNLFSSVPDAFDEDDQALALMLCTHASVVVTGARRQEKIAHLQRALVNSREIGAAIGVLMHQHKLTQDQAFDLLRVSSQHLHRKLADVAADVVATGELTLPSLHRR